jgi:multiple sugar transport system substrate-binding protein
VIRKRNLMGVVLVGIIFLTIAFSAVAFAQKVTIEFSTCWWLEPGRDKWLETVVQRFEKENPDITVKPVPIPYKEYNDKMKILFAGGGAPDVFYMLQHTVSLWQEMGWLEPLDKYWNFDELMPQLMVPEVQMTAEIDGHMYGLNTEACNYGGLIYNTKIFEEAGLTVPETPAAFKDTAIKLTKAPDMYGFIAPNIRETPSYLMQHAMCVIHGFGGGIIKRGKFVINELDFIDGVEYYKELFDVGVMPQGMDYTTQRKMFWNGKAAMCIDGGYFMTWAAGSNPEVTGQLNVAPPPFRSKLNPLDPSFFGVSSASSEEEKKGAIKFLEFWITPEIQQEFIETCGYPITMKSAISPEFRAKYPWFNVYEASAPFGVPLAIPGYEQATEEIRKIIAGQIEAVLLGGISAEEAMNKAQNEVERLVGISK